MSSSPTDPTTLLTNAQEDPAAARELVELLYGELRTLASRLLERESPGHTLQPTALVHELWLKLIDQSRIHSNSRPHFLAIASRAMRQILVNHALAKQTQKRGASWSRQPLHPDIATAPTPSTDLVALDRSLTRLAQVRSRVAEVVEMRFFGGMTVADTAAALEVSPRTVAVDWEFARAWISRDMGEGGEDD